MARKKEIEAKFSCPKEVLREIAKLGHPAPGYKWGETSTFMITDTYLDTNDHRLLNREACLRCRDKDGRLKVTLKLNSMEQEGVLEREEIEEEVSREAFHALLGKGKPPSFVMPALRRYTGGKSVKPVLDVRNQREVREILRTDDSLIGEISIDQAIFSGFGVESDFSGIEIELKSGGSIQDLKALTRNLESIFPDLKVDLESKYLKGIRLVTK